MPNWIIKIAKKAEKGLNKFPSKDQQHILQTLDAMAEDPFSGDIARLRNERSAWRRRAGNYRIFYDVHPSINTVDIVEINRRTSNTY